MEHRETIAETKPMLPPSDPSVGNQSKPKKPRLTLKALLELIHALQEENQKLARRLDDLEGQIALDRALREEAAATAEPPIATAIPGDDGETPVSEEQPPSSEIGRIRPEYRLDGSGPSLLPRSKRHPARKKLFWGIF